MTPSELRSELEDLMVQHAICLQSHGVLEEGCCMWSDLEEILERYDGK